uniref:Uncharacterized protein n=1 Tax=Tanacetum cinerariifolium TaxID=118510 RepID=A0A699K2F9_TANCI|nr:hypothetical protein [Tanacetum cinerariifolium]
MCELRKLGDDLERLWCELAGLELGRNVWELVDEVAWSWRCVGALLVFKWVEMEGKWYRENEGKMAILNIVH